MINIRRVLFGRQPTQRPIRTPQKPASRFFAAGLEQLEGRLLMNVHPAGETPHHIHPHLAIFIDGQNFVIPASIGNASPGPLLGTANENAHTHTNDGILHYNEATPAFRDLKEFFDTWSTGAIFTQSRLKLPIAYDSNGQATQFTDKTVDATHTIRFFVNGSPSSDFDQYEPEDGDQMVISYEALPVANAPTLNPINNVTMASNPTAGAPVRTIFIPLDGSDPNNLALNYTVTSSSPSVTATIEPSSNRFLKLNVSGKDISGNPFSGDLTFQLFDDITPNTVSKIVSLVQSGFYNNNFNATLNAAQEVPATSSSATGTATFVFNPTTNTFDIDVRVQGITLAQLTMAHIHSAAPGVDGPIIVDLGDASQWVVDGTGIRRTIQGASFPAASVSALLAGNTYVNIHTVANPDGEIRGQLNHIPFHRIINDFMAQGGSRTGTGQSDTTMPDFADEFNSAATFTGFGQLAMANAGDDTNDTQFFITDTNLSLFETSSSPEQDPPSPLNFQHTIFGQLVSGFDTFNTMMLTPVHSLTTGSEKSVPNSPVSINSASIVADTQHAVLRLSAAANFSGSSNISVTTTNGTNQTATRSFVTTVAADTVNDRAFLGTIPNPTTRLNTPITIALPATDLENDTLSFVVRDPTNFSGVPANVSVSINQATREATLTPATGFTGTINLLIGVRDQTRRVDTNGDGSITTADSLDVRENFDTQVVTLTVTDANIAPIANAQTVQYSVNTPVTITLTGDDGDPGVTQTLTFVIDTLPATGTLRDSNQATVTAGATLPSATLTYTPATGSTASTQFTFHVVDNGGTANGGQNTSTSATVSLTSQVNHEPTATPQTVHFQSGTPLTIQLAGADGDPDATQTLSFVVTALPSDGTLRDSANNLVTVGTVLPSNTVTYTPDSGFTDDDDFTFQVRDNGGTANGGDDTSQTATISLQGPGSGPVAPIPGLKNGVLTILGTRDDDVVTVELSADGDSIEVIVNGAATEEFPLVEIEKIRIRCSAGDDDVSVSDEVEVSAHIRGGQGNDLLTGGGGDDVIRGKRGDDEVDGGEGDDRIFGGRGEDDLSGSAGVDHIRGRKGDDIIDGGDDDDRIHGGQGDDDIDGGDGDDIARGGLGNDTVDNVEQSRGGGGNSAIASLVAERQSSTRDDNVDTAIASMSEERLSDAATSDSGDLDSSLHASLVDALLGGLA